MSELIEIASKPWIGDGDENPFEDNREAKLIAATDARARRLRIEKTIDDTRAAMANIETKYRPGYFVFIGCYCVSALLLVCGSAGLMIHVFQRRPRGAVAILGATLLGGALGLLWYFLPGLPGGQSPYFILGVFISFSAMISFLYTINVIHSRKSHRQQ